MAEGLRQIWVAGAMTALPRWKPEDSVRLVRRKKIDGAPFKRLQTEFGRSHTALHKQFHKLETMLESSHGEILERHREEELELLEKLLREQRSPEAYGDERP